MILKVFPPCRLQIVERVAKLLLLDMVLSKVSDIILRSASVKHYYRCRWIPVRLYCMVQLFYWKNRVQSSPPFCKK